MVGWVMAIKLLLFLIGVTSYPMLWNRYPPSPRNWLQIWDQWDFGYYQKIAELGYSRDDGSIAFYPLFPWLIRLFACNAQRMVLSHFSDRIFSSRRVQ